MTPEEIKAMKPRDVEGLIRERIKKAFGDVVENSAMIYSTRGTYYVSYWLDDIKHDAGFKRKSVPAFLEQLKRFAASQK